MDNITTGSSWYAEDGDSNDVILSTKVRLSRNLSDFPFPSFMKSDEGDRVQAIIFDAFSKLPEAERFQALAVSNLELLGKRILVERGILYPDGQDKNGSGVIIRNDGKIACTVNYLDHLHIESFSAGLNPDVAKDSALDLDSVLQHHLQFAGNTDFGYLTSMLYDAGTGMHIELMLHLPAITTVDLQDKLFKTIINSGFDVFACFSSTTLTLSEKKPSAFGSYYKICTNVSFPCSETDQVATVMSAAHNIIEIERKTREDLCVSSPTLLKDRVCRALAVIRYSRYVGLSEGIELISAVKLGLDMGLVSGISDSSLLALLYRIQTAHLMFVTRNGNFSYENDVISPEQKTDRLRSLVLQEAISDVHLEM